MELGSRLFLKEIEEYVRKRESFALETTLSGKSYLKLVEALQDAGWQVELIYLWLPSVEMSIDRVAERVSHGGHDVRKEDIIRRYPRSVNNLIHHFAPLCDGMVCIDNSTPEQTTIFIQEKGERIVKHSELYKKMLDEVNHD